MAQREPWSREFGTLLSSLFLGAASGAVSGFIVASLMQQPQASERGPVMATTTQGESQATSTRPTSTLELIPLERRAASPLVPPAFLNRRVSSVAGIYRKPKPADDHVLGPERLIGQAVALTSDGWFAAPASLFDDARVGDLLIWVDGAAYPIDRGVTDSLSGAAFLKISATGLTPSAFARAQDVSIGTELWMEARPGEFSPSLALSTSARVAPNDAVSSEAATRRINVVGTAMRGDLGAAAWDPNGSLVGINDGANGEHMRLIPASGIASSFASLLARGSIAHAYLGVRAVDLASLRTDQPRDTRLIIGAMITNDKRGLKPGVQKDGPAAGKLKAGDVIVRVERDILDGTADLGEVLAEYQPGTQVTLRVWREGKDLDVPLTLGEIATGDALK